MKDYESKNPNKQKDLETLPMAVIDAPDATSDAGTSLDGPPSDGEGCESVTVLIVINNQVYGSLMAASVRQNLYGADADVQIAVQKGTLIETVLNHLPDVQTERIILMTEGMFILNPVTICDIGVWKMPMDRMPMLYHKSVLTEVLTYLKRNYPYADIADSYHDLTRNYDILPLPAGDWHTEPWLLPVVSNDPSIEVLSKYAQWKKFMHVSPRSWSPSLITHLKRRFQT